MGLLSNIGQNLQDITAGKRSFASLFNGGVDPYSAPAKPLGQDPAQPISPVAKNTNPQITTPQQAITQTPNNSPYSQPVSSPNIKAASSTTQSAPLANGSQTFKFGDGSVYDQNQNLISKPGNNVDTSSGPNITANSPSTTTPSSSLGSAPSSSAVNLKLNNNTATADTLFNNLNTLFQNQQNAQAGISQFGQPNSQELAAQGQVASAQQQVGQAQQNQQLASGQAQGFINPGGQPTDLQALTGQGALKQFNANQGLISAQLNQQLAQTNLAYQQGNRQIAYTSAVQLFNASHQNLQDAISVYQAAAPKNINTNYNPLTGDLNTVMINPLSGETYTVNNGNIGASTPIQNVSTSTNPLTGQLTITGTNAAGQPITYSVDQNGKITGNSIQGTTNPQGGSPGSLVSPNINPQAVVGGYDLTSYAGGSSATGSYGPTVNGIYNKIPTISNAQDAQSYINSVSGNSPITGQMVMQASSTYGVDPKVMMAVMQEESSMGTAGMATKTFNPGNVGNNSDTKKQTNWGSWQNGVNAVAQNLQHRQINSSTNPGTMIANGASPQQVIQQVVSSLPSTISQAVNYLADGTPYIDENLITPGLETAARTQGQAVGIKSFDAGSATRLQKITTTQNDLRDFKVKADAALSSVGWGAQYLNAAGLWAGQAIGNTSAQDFSSFRTSAISALESLASGTGTGFRITTGELTQAIDNIPTLTDTKTQADNKIHNLNIQLNNVIAASYPGWLPPQ